MIRPAVHPEETMLPARRCRTLWPCTVRSAPLAGCSPSRRRSRPAAAAAAQARARAPARRPRSPRQDFCPSVDALGASVASAKKLDPKTASKADFEAAASDLRQKAGDVTVALKDTTDTAALNVQRAAHNLRLSRQGLPEGTTVAQALYHLRPSLIYLGKAIQSAHASLHCADG